MSVVQKVMGLDVIAEDSAKIKKVAKVKKVPFYKRALKSGIARIKEVAGTVTTIAKADLSIARQLWKSRRSQSIVRLMTVFALVSNPFLSSYSTGRIVQTLSNGEKVELTDANVFILMIALLMAGALPAIVSALDRMLDNWAFEYVQGANVTKVPEFDAHTFSDPVLKGEIRTVHERSVWRATGLAKSQAMLLKALALAIIATVVLAQFKIWLPGLILVAMVGAMVCEGLHAHRQFQTEEVHQEWWRDFWAGLWRLLNSKTLDYLQRFGAAHWFAGRFEKNLRETTKAYDRIELRGIWSRLGSMTMGMGSVIFAVLFLLTQVNAKQLSIADFVLYLGSLSLLGISLLEVSNLLGQQLGQGLYVEKFKRVQAIEPKTRYPRKGEIPEILSEGISLELKDVCFGYPKGEGSAAKEVLKKISLWIAAGQKIAIVGSNGAGKSTLLQILCRVFDPTFGEVLLGGISLKELDQETLKKMIGCLPQEICHFNLTVGEFICLGRSSETVDEDRMKWAAQQSGASEFVEKYPAQYDQRLGHDTKDSQEPSGGQLQKLALASLLYTKAPIIVLDEPTAAIDPPAAKSFWNFVFNSMKSQTVIFSTHYFGAVRRADKIIVMDDGQIIACGTHNELMESCKMYRELFNSQGDDYQ